MQQVIDNRQHPERLDLFDRMYALPLELPDVDGYAASQDCTDIGSIVWVQIDGKPEWYRLLIVDCASQTDARESDGLSGYEWMVQNNVLLEWDFEFARDVAGKTGGGVKIRMAWSDPRD
jgi:hypothetical protein